MPVIPVSRSWRRLLRFSVRGMIVFVLLFGVGLGWVARRARIQREAVATIRAAGGFVEYQFPWRNVGPAPGAKPEPWEPLWLVDRIGIDYFGRVTAIDFTENSAVRRASVRNLSAPVLLRTGVTDGMDAGLSHFKDFTDLERLDLFGNDVSDAGLANLKGLTKLTELNLLGSEVSDGGLANLKGLKNLSHLKFTSSRISDAGLVHLKGMTSLSVLDLCNTDVSDAGLLHLAGLTELTHLNLWCTNVSDAGMVHLKGLTKLAVLELRYTRVTESGVKQLLEALPGLAINRNPGHLLAE